MPRGAAQPVGAKFVNQNGYEHTKTKDRGWVATHVLIAEANLGRELRPNEFVKFLDNDRKNLDPTNIVIRLRGDSKSPQARLAAIESRIEDLQAEAEELRQEIAKQNLAQRLESFRLKSNKV